jgi:hypothetical protein
MDPFDKVRFTFLRAELTRTRLEKIALTREIQAPRISAAQKHHVKRRYSAVNAEMHIIAHQLEDLIAETKQAMAARRFPNAGSQHVHLAPTTLEIRQLMGTAEVAIGRT